LPGTVRFRIFRVLNRYTDMNNEVIQNAIKEVESSFPSIYSKEDVVKLLTEINSRLEEESGKVDLDKFKDRFLDLFNRKLHDARSNDLVDFDTAEFDISHNNMLVLEHVDVLCDKIAEIAEDAFDSVKL